MGLIKAALGAAGGALADQWRDFFSCDSMDENVLVVKGTKNKAIVYMNPDISNEFILGIKEAFEIEGEPIIKLDFSKHYKCYLD